MASGTTDLQRDLGGALMQSIFGALLAAGFASSMSTAVAAAPNASEISSSVRSQLMLLYASAENIAQQYPQYADQITAAAKTAFLAGDDKAYIAGIIAVLIGAALVFFFYPRHDKEKELLQQYQVADAKQ
jgi:hypothetical protein